MPIVTRVVIKDFNGEKLQEELAAASLPIVGITWAGFERLDDRRHRPFVEASRVVGTSSASGDDEAVRGELRFTSPDPLTVPQMESLDAVLQAHDSVLETAEQQRQTQDETDMNTLFTSDLAAYKNHLLTWDAKTNAQKHTAAAAMFLTLGKVMRVFIRRNRAGGGDI